MKIGHLFILAFGAVFGMLLIMLIVKGFTSKEPPEADDPASFFQGSETPNERQPSLPSDEDSETCLENLATLATTCHAYTTIDRRQMYPPGLKAIVDVGLSFDRQALRCPADTAQRDGAYTSYESAFDIIGREVSNDLIPGDFMMIWDSVPRHSGTRCVVLFNLKTVQMLEDDFQGELVKLREKLHELTAPAREPRGNEVFDDEELELLLNLE